MTAAPARRFYYGWVIVGIAWFCFLTAISTTLYGFGLFTLPVSKEFGLSRSDFNTGITIVHIADALVSPLVGWLADRYSIRRIMMAASVCLGIALVALGLSTSLTLNVLILAVVVPFGFVATTSITNYSLIARWFRARRGRAMAIAAIGQSSSGILGVPLVSYLIDTVGWRDALLIMGGVAGIGLLVLTSFVIDRPRPGDVEPVPRTKTAPIPSIAQDDRYWTAWELLRSGRFWQFTIAAALVIGAITSIMLSLVPYGQGLGMSTLRASTLISALATSSIMAKFGLAFVADRVDRTLLFALGASGLAFLCGVLLLEPAYPVLIAACLIGGFSLGTTYPLFAAIMADSFGSRSYGRVLGLGGPVLALTNAGTAKFVGIVHDRAGSYDVAFGTFIVTSLLAACLLMVPFGRRRGETVPDVGPARVEPGPAVDPL